MKTAGLLLGLLALSVCAVAEDVSVTQWLLPRPQQTEMRAGQFAFEKDRLRFSLAAKTQDEVARLVTLIEEAQHRLGVSSRIETRTGDAFSLVVSEATLERDKSGPLPDQLGEEGYELLIVPSGAAIRARAAAGLLHGMLTLEQLITAATVRGEPGVACLRILDWPALAMRGYHEDYGRDQVPTLEDHQRSIRTLAQFKMNSYLWFIEPDHFIYRFDPELSTEYDRFDLTEIPDRVDYASRHYIEVFPVVELLGHMEMTLRNERYKDLAEMPEGGGDLCATSDASFDLVTKMANEIAPAFPGRYFHCGLDESYAIGKGRSVAAVQEKGIEQVFADYYTKLDGVVKAQRRTMVMYADIVLNHPGMLALLPKDIVMMFWDYAPRERYPGLTKLAESGHPIMALSGLWDWNNLYPRYPAAFKNMETLCAQSRDAGALGHFVSSWGDGYRGAAGVNLSELNYFGVVYCGALGWKPEPIPMDEYAKAFALHFFADASPELADALVRLARCQGDGLDFNCEPKFVLMGDARERVDAMKKAQEDALAFWQTLKTEASAAQAVLAAARPARNADYLKSAELAARMLMLAADMALTYRDAAAGAGGEKTAAALDALTARHRALWPDYERTYLATNEPLNLEHIRRVWRSTEDSLAELAAGMRAGAGAAGK